jgi:hypothetical protein
MASVPGPVFGAGVNRSARQHPADRAHQLIGLLTQIVRPAVAFDEAMADVAIEQAECNLVERRAPR